MQRVQDNLDALAQEIRGRPTSTGQIPHELSVDVDLAFVGARAASFVVLVSPRRDQQLFESPLVREALDRMLRVVAASQDEQQLQSELADLHRRALTKFRDLLEVLEEAESGIGVFVATPDREVRTARLSYNEVQSTLRIVRQTAAAPGEILTVEGILVGANMRTGVFEILDDRNNIRYVGKAIDQALSELYSLTTGKRYRAIILREVEESVTGDTTVKNRLTHIEPMEPAEPLLP